MSYRARAMASSRSLRRPRYSKDSDAAHIASLYRAIYAVIRKIPRGHVVTYGQVAELAGLPRAARVVGVALRASTPAMGLPWQRVLGKKARGRARISILDPVGAAMQRSMLESEGVIFIGSHSDTVELDRFGWLEHHRARDRGR
jgi:methylated-DNA-protein-cysteine methyltransferase-like protein